MLWGIAFFNYADRQALSAVVPLLEKEFHLDSAQLGLLGSAFAFAYGLCGPFAGAIVERVRRVGAILWGLSFGSVLCVSPGLSRPFGQPLAFGAAEGLGDAVSFPASMSLISAWHTGPTR